MTPVASLRAAGFSFAKVAALKDLAAKTLQRVVPAHAELVALSDEEIIERLTQVRGIGRWTVEMMLHVPLGRPDVLPVDDFGVRAGFMAAYGLRTLPHPKVLAAYGERWKPYRSVAAWYLWRALELKRAGTLPAPRRAHSAAAAEAAPPARRAGPHAAQARASDGHGAPRRASGGKRVRARVSDAQQRLIAPRLQVSGPLLALEVVAHGELIAAQLIDRQHGAPGVGAGLAHDVHGGR